MRALTKKPIDCARVDSSAAGHRGRGFALNLDFSARWFWAALVVLLSAWIVHGFFQPLAWAAMLAAATWPIYRRFAAWMPSGMAQSVTPAAFTLLVLAFVLAPIVFAFGAVAMQSQSLLDQLALADKVGLAPPAWLGPCLGSAPDSPNAGACCLAHRAACRPGCAIRRGAITASSPVPRRSQDGSRGPCPEGP